MKVEANISPPKILKRGATQLIEKICAKQKTNALIITSFFSLLKILLYLIKKNVQNINSWGKAEKKRIENKDFKK